MPSSNNVRKVTSENYPTEDGREGLHLLMVDPHIPAGAKLY